MNPESIKSSKHQTKKATNQGRHEGNPLARTSYKKPMQKASALAGVEGHLPQDTQGRGRSGSGLPRKGIPMPLIREFGKKWRLRTGRDECGETIIPGKRGHIFDYGDGERFGLLYMSDQPRLWAYAKKKLVAPKFKLRQDGDTEGIATFNPLDPEAVRLALKIAGIKTRRIASPAQLQALRKAFKARQLLANQRARTQIAI